MVTEAALDDTMPAVAEEVATARERATATQFELTKARNAAEPVADIPIVAARLDTYEEEVPVLLERVEELKRRHETRRSGKCSYVDSTAEELDGLAARQDDFADRLDRFEGELDRLEPPVDWMEMQATLESI